MKDIELLAPAGSFNSLIAAVQNGANAVYFGSEKFNARAGSKNFTAEEMKRAIEYAKLRNVKTNLTLNILIKNDEFDEAMELAGYAYSCGVDALIVQDLGLAKKIIETYPDLEVHASTQMTVYNKNGVEELEKLGFKRAVLARELNIEEIKEICDKSKIDIEVFIHGALCISYSGQCLMSSMIGGRSGNRGKCAGTCRLPYELVNKETGKTEEKGYLLSSKDVCTLDILPELLNAGVKSLKIEGRMKSPEYVGIVTGIYRKYIDMAQSKEKYVVDEEDRQKLLQIFNRGGFSTGYLKGKLGKDMMYTKKPNHIGIPIGQVMKYNPNKGYVTFKAKEKIALGDSIRINEGSCKISELMIGNNNIKEANIDETITVGRIKGNIKVGDTIYRTVSIKLMNEIEQINSKENIKRNIICNVVAKCNKEIYLQLEDLLTGITTFKKGNIVQEAKNMPTTKERLKEQLEKTGGTVFAIKNINIEMDDNVFIPIKDINELRRECLQNLEKSILETIPKEARKPEEPKEIKNMIKEEERTNSEEVKVSVLLNKINPKYRYDKLEDIDNIYIHLSQVWDKENAQAIEEIIKNFNTYLYLPSILKGNYLKITEDKIKELVEKGFKGLVISNLSQIDLGKDLKVDKIANYTMNIFNDQTIKELKKEGISKITISPELNKEEIANIRTNSLKELIVYGRTLLMTSEYCPIGKFIGCNGKCEKGRYVLKDRMGFEFLILTDRRNCNSMIYNSKTTSISYKGLNINEIRLDMIYESIEEMNNIIKIHKRGDRLEGQEYTNGSISREDI